MKLNKNVGKILNKKIGVMGVLGTAMNVHGAVTDYKQSRLDGHGKVGSAITAAGNAVMFEAVGMPQMLALGAIKHAPGLAVDGALKVQSMARSMDRAAQNSPFVNSTFADSKQAFTMRQAGMQLAQASKYNLQQSLMGNEAASMHRL